MATGKAAPLHSFRTERNNKDEVYEVVYTPGSEDGSYTRTVRRLRLITRPIDVDAQVKARRRWKRFGRAKGAIGLERGVSMVSQEDNFIDDPFGEEAEVTGEDKMIERIKASVGKSRSNAVNRELNSPDRRQHSHTHTSNYNAKGRRSAGRNSYNRSPGRNRQNRSPGRAYGRPSPSDASQWRGQDSRTHTPGGRRPQ